MEKTYFKIGDRVKVMRSNPDDPDKMTEIKRGRIIQVGSTFARVFDSKSENDFIDCTEWFPYEGRCIKMVKV